MVLDDLYAKTKTLEGIKQLLTATCRICLSYRHFLTTIFGVSID
jgi:hypothetical protein